MPPLPDPRTARRVRLLATAAFAVVLIGLAVAWSVTPLSSVLDPPTLARHAGRVRSWPFAGLAVVAGYVVAGLLAAPATLMIGVTVLLFGAWPGALYAYAGMLVNAGLLYAIGRFAARDLVDQWLARRDGSRLDAFNHGLAQRGFAAVVLLRLTPVPYSLINVLAGASRIRIVHYVLGTAVGIVPVIAVLAGLASRLDAWLARPDWRQLATLVAAALVFVVAVGTLGRWALRRSTGR